MGLIITPNEKPITISGTSLTLDSTYARIIFTANPDGLQIVIGYEIFASKQMWIDGKIIATDIPINNFTAQIDPLTQEQSISVALEFAKQGFEQLGYTATIDAE